MTIIIAGATESLNKPSKDITKAGTREVVENTDFILEIKLEKFEHFEYASVEKQEQSQISSPPR